MCVCVRISYCKCAQYGRKTHCTGVLLLFLKCTHARILVCSDTTLELHCCIHFQRVNLLSFFSCFLVCKFLHYIFIWLPWSIGIVPKCNQFEKSRLLCRVNYYNQQQTRFSWACACVLVSFAKLFPTLWVWNVSLLKMFLFAVDWIDPIPILAWIDSHWHVEWSWAIFRMR